MDTSHTLAPFNGPADNHWPLNAKFQRLILEEGNVLRLVTPAGGIDMHAKRAATGALTVTFRSPYPTAVHVSAGEDAFGFSVDVLDGEPALDHERLTPPLSESEVVLGIVRDLLLCIVKASSQPARVLTLANDALDEIGSPEDRQPETEAEMLAAFPTPVAVQELIASLDQAKDDPEHVRALLTGSCEALGFAVI